MTRLRKDYGKILKKAREAKHWTQPQTAASCEVSQQSIARIETHGGNTLSLTKSTRAPHGEPVEPRTTDAQSLAHFPRRRKPSK